MTRRRSDPARERRVQRGPAPKWRNQRVFYVAAEGESTEPDYLTYLNRQFGPEHGFIIHPLYKRNGMTPGQVVARALAQRHEAAVDDDRSEFWAVFDRDQHRDIPHAIRAAEAGGVRVAFSHPSFDLWLLLHFTVVSGRQRGSSRVIHEKLRGCGHGFERFGAAGDNKHIRGGRAAALVGRQQTATKRAQRLVDECPAGACAAHAGHAAHCDPLQRDPSTGIWLLLVALGVASGVTT